jgi:hypothetical protein
VFGSGWTKEYQVRLGDFHALSIISEHALRLQPQFTSSRLHPIGLFVTYPHDLDVLVPGGKPQIIEHVEVIKIDTRDAPSCHAIAPRLCRLAIQVK